MKTPILETTRLQLRPFQKEDAQEVFDCWESDPYVSKYMYWNSHDDINKTKEWIDFELGNIEKDDWYRFALMLKETGELIGTGLIYYDEDISNWAIGYNLGKKFWGKGYVTEAMKRIIQFAKEELHIKELDGRYAKANHASGRIMDKLGFQYVKDIPYDCNDGGEVLPGIQKILYL